MEYMIQFTKRGTLREFYFTDKLNWSTSMDTAWVNKEREISLFLIYHGQAPEGGVIVSIKCPCNPLPIKGKWIAPSFAVVRKWLINHDWMPAHNGATLRIGSDKEQERNVKDDLQACFED